MEQLWLKTIYHKAYLVAKQKAALFNTSMYVTQTHGNKERITFE